MCWNTKIITTTTTAVTAMITMRWVLMFAPNTATTSPVTGESRNFGVVPCQSPMNACTTIAAPNVAITTTCTDRPRNGAYANRSSTIPTMNMIPIVTR